MDQSPDGSFDEITLPASFLATNEAGSQPANLAVNRCSGRSDRCKENMARSNPSPFLSPLFFSTWPFRLLYSSLIMTVIETIMRDIQGLSLRQQVEVARYVQRLSETARHRRVAVLRQTHGSLDEADGRAFEEALTESRRVETDG